MGYWAAAAGILDLSAGVPWLVEASRKAGLLVLSANLFYKGRRVFPAYKVFKVSGVRIGVVGLTGPPRYGKALPPGVRIEPLETVLSRVLPKVKARSDAVVVLTQLGMREGRALAKKVNGMDVLILASGGPPTMRPNREGRTYILAPHSKGRSVGKLTLWTGPKGLEKVEGSIVLLRSYFPEDKGVLERLKALGSGGGKGKAEENPLLKAIEKAKKERKAQGVTTGGTKGKRPAANPFLELLKRRKAAQEPKETEGGR